MLWCKNPSVTRCTDEYLSASILGFPVFLGLNPTSHRHNFCAWPEPWPLLRNLSRFWQKVGLWVEVAVRGREGRSPEVSSVIYIHLNSYAIYLGNCNCVEMKARQSDDPTVQQDLVLSSSQVLLYGYCWRIRAYEYLTSEISRILVYKSIFSQANTRRAFWNLHWIWDMVNEMGEVCCV